MTSSVRVLSILLVLAISTLACSIAKLTVRQWPPSDISSCESWPSPNENFEYTQRDCYRYFLNQSTDVNDCKIVSDPFEVATCQFSVAVNTNSAEVCELLTEQSLRETCLHRVYTSLIPIAVENNDPSICDRMQGFEMEDGTIFYGTRNECYFEVAVARKRPELCSLITGALIFGLANEENCLINSQ